MSRGGLIVAAVVMSVVIAAGCLGWWLFATMPNGVYYTQVDNTRTEQLEPTGGFIDPTGGMVLSYTLPAFDAEGDMQEITFGTERELREDAYLRLTVVPIRGVMEWNEVAFEELPPQVQARFA